MNSQSQQVLDDTERMLFESREFQVSRDLITQTVQNSGTSDDIETLLSRVHVLAPAMNAWINSIEDM